MQLLTGAEIPMNEKKLNKALLALLGTEELVNNWWNSPNANWSFQNPIDVYQKDPKSVCDYIMQYVSK